MSCRKNFLFSISLFIAWFIAISSVVAEEKKAAEPQIIMQGGYREIVDPNVDYKDRLPRIAPIEPAESLKKFRMIPGFQLQQVATEPLIADSVDLAFDENGRMFVVEMIPYSENNSVEFGSPNGRVSLLEDTDNDGIYDKSTVYADGLVWPTGVMAYDGGIYVASAPDLWYFKDTDGDNRADLREKVLTGYETTNPNAVPGSIRFGLDNRIHVMTSTAGGMITPLKWQRHTGKTVDPVQSRGRDLSLDPVTGEMRLETGGSQYGTTFDQWGRKFESSNSAPCKMVMYENRYAARNPFYAAPGALIKAWNGGLTVYPISPPEPWRIVRMEMRIKGNFNGPVEGGGAPNGYFTAACGVMNYQGDAWPEKYRGNMFTCEGAGNLIHRMEMRQEGVQFRGFRADEKTEFLTSEEIWFRPCQIANGPDGNLYFADMYREIFEIASAVPPSAKKHLDLSCGNDRGRIYRIFHESNPTPRKTPRLGDSTTDQLVALIEHPNFWHRKTAARLLFERQDQSAIAALKKLAAESKNPVGRMQARYTLDGLGALDEATVLAGLGDESPRVREHAIRLSEKFLKGKDSNDLSTLCNKICGMADEDDIRLLYQLAFTLGEINRPEATVALAKITEKAGEDRWIRVAMMTSCTARADRLFAILSKNPDWRKTPIGVKVLQGLARQVGLENDRKQLANLIEQIDALPESESSLVQTVVDYLCRGQAGAGGGNGDLLAESEKVNEALEALLEKAIETAENEDAKAKVRAGAIGSLGLASFDDVGDTLAEMVASRQPKSVQVAAIQTLNRFRDEGVAEILIDAWGGFSPEVRKQAAEAIFARPNRLNALLDALEEEQIKPSQLDPARIEFLVKHPNSEIAARAKELLGSAKLARRDDVVQQYKPALEMKGDIDRGRKVFRRECIICHRLENTGFDLGLPLGSIKDRGPDTILLSTLDPNRDVQPQYLNYVIITDDGLSITGMIGSETATSVTLTRAEGESDTVLRANIDEMENSGMSIMPEGLEKQINANEMADLIEYLMNVE